MGKILEILINQFNGAISEDKRAGWTSNAGGVSTTNKYSIAKHFDVYTYPKKLVPYVKRETANGLSGGVVTTLKLTRFLYARTTSSTTFRLFALGDDGTGHVEIYKLDIDGASDLDTANFVAATNGTSSSGTRQTSMLFYYKSFIYTFSGTTNLNRYDVTEVAGFSDDYQTLATTTNAIRPVHHPTDDIAYFFSDNVIYALNNTSWSGAVLTLPSDSTITAACAFGNYLAIATVSNGNLDRRSIVYLWDRDSSLTTLTSRIDFGEGAIVHLANLNNKLIAVINYYTTNAYGLSKAKILVKTPSGDFAVTLSELDPDTTLTSSDFPIDNMLRDNRLYFPMKATLNGDTRVGIWAVDQNGKLSLDQIEPALDTNANASAIRGIYATANIWWIAYDDGSGGVGAYSVTRSDDEVAYDTSNPAVLETLIWNGDDPTLKKKLIGVSVMTEPLPTGAQIVLKYRKNQTAKDGTVVAETSWTTIFTATTHNTVCHEATKIESTGANLPEHQEIQFRIESTGGAVITAFKAKAEILDEQLY